VCANFGREICSVPERDNISHPIGAFKGVQPIAT
jgi:hypothetical protein